MHQSPQKQLGGYRREKYAASKDPEGDAADLRLQRAAQPKARRFAFRDEDKPREERGRQHPRG